LAPHLTKALGALLILFALAPAYQLTGISGGGPTQAAYTRTAEATLQLAWWGSLVVVLLSIILSFLFKDAALRLGRILGQWLAKPRLSLFAVGVGLLAFALSLALGELLYQGLYTNLDEMASAIHARYLAGGSLAGPLLEYPEGWLITNTLMVDDGWVSQYPPSHLAVMALFYRLGVPRVAGPVLLGLTVGLLALALPRLLPERPAAARAAAALTALSPFLLFLGGGALSHLTAGAAGAAVLYSVLRARDGSWLWALAAGGAVGVMVSARPLIGLVLGTVFPLLAWGPGLLAGPTKPILRRGAALVAGGAPFALLLGLYNHKLFGSPFRLGYLAAYGRDHGLGFHPDPWGYMYDAGRAFALTSVDFLALGVQLLETPLPLTVFVGLALLGGWRLSRGSAFLLAWALLPLLAAGIYWFHEPRMLFEAAPAWIALGVLAVVKMASWTRTRGPEWTRAGQVVSWAVVVSLVAGLGWGVPNRWSAYTWTPETLDRIQVPTIPGDEPALVFVHASWNERLSARLQGAGGMRQDSIVTALRRNTNCQLQHHADAREAVVRGESPARELPPIDMVQSGETPPDLIQAMTAPGQAIRTRDGEVMDSVCLREMRADRFGSVALAPLLWQGDLPGDEGRRPLFVRDLGPEKNARIRSLFPRRTAYLFAPMAPGVPPEVTPYERGVRLLWGPDPM
jgi:hypothetical protein